MITFKPGSAKDKETGKFRAVLTVKSGVIERRFVHPKLYRYRSEARDAALMWSNTDREILIDRFNGNAHDPR